MLVLTIENYKITVKGVAMKLDHFSSIYTDADIEIASKSQILISENFEPKCLEQACYELRASSKYYDLTTSQNLIEVKETEEILVKPHHLVVVITLEKLSIPNNVIARIVSKGALFSCGLLPVSTIADPGFIGNMGIVLHNISENYITLPVGEKIAKIDFTCIGKDVRGRYSGQHGYGTGVWIIKKQFIKSYSQIKNHPLMKSEFDETMAVSSPVIKDGFMTIFKDQRFLYLGLILLLLLNILITFAVSRDIMNITISIFTGIIANIGYGIMVWRSTKLGGITK